MLDLFNGDSFVIKNKFLKELDCAIQATAILLTTSSPMAPYNTSLYEFRGRNITDETRPEISIKIDKVSELIVKDYPIVKGISLSSIEEDPENADGFLIELMFITTEGKTYLVELQV